MKKTKLCKSCGGGIMDRTMNYETNEKLWVCRCCGETTPRRNRVSRQMIEQKAKDVVILARLEKFIQTGEL